MGHLDQQQVVLVQLEVVLLRSEDGAQLEVVVLAANSYRVLGQGLRGKR
jgi:hypothetical protein